MATWQTAAWAHGPVLAAWVDAELVRQGRDPAEFPSLARALHRWRTRPEVSFWTVDRWAVALGRLPFELPATVWGDGPPAHYGRGHAQTVA